MHRLARNNNIICTWKTKLWIIQCSAEISVQWRGQTQVPEIPQRLLRLRNAKKSRHTKCDLSTFNFWIHVGHFTQFTKLFPTLLSSLKLWISWARNNYCSLCLRSIFLIHRHVSLIINLISHADANTIHTKNNTNLIDHSPEGLFRANETQWNDRTEQQQLLRIPTGWRQTSWLFKSADGKLNQVLPGTNSASGQRGSWTRDLRISRHCRPNHWFTLPPKNADVYLHSTHTFDTWFFGCLSLSQGWHLTFSFWILGSTCLAKLGSLAFLVCSKRKTFTKKD